MNRLIIIIVSVLVLLIGGLYMFIEKSDFWEIDRCLDSGGSWNYETKECINCESDFTQQKKAESYSVRSNYEIENRTEWTLDSFQIVPNGYVNENYIEIPAKATRKFITDMLHILEAFGHPFRKHPDRYSGNIRTPIPETFGQWFRKHSDTKLGLFILLAQKRESDETNRHEKST